MEIDKWHQLAVLFIFLSISHRTWFILMLESHERKGADSGSPPSALTRHMLPFSISE